MPKTETQPKYMATKDKSDLPSIIVSALIATHIAALMSTSKPSGPFEGLNWWR
jgi:hypothetical protein